MYKVHVAKSLTSIVSPIRMPLVKSCKIEESASNEMSTVRKIILTEKEYACTFLSIVMTK